MKHSIAAAALTFLICGWAASLAPADAQAVASPSPAPAPSSSIAPSAAPSPSPSASPAPPPKPLQFSGFADASYSSLSTVNNASFTFLNGTSTRVFDTVNRLPQLNALNLQAVGTSGPLVAKVEVELGDDADIIAPYATNVNDEFDLTQAYLAFTTGKLTLTGGKFETLAGAEVIESPSNLNFSRSILFGYAVPFTHVGGRATYAFSSAFSLIAGINAGWDVFRDTNKQKTVEGGIAYTPPGQLSFTAQGYSGVEQISNNPLSGAQGNRNLFDAVVTYKPLSTLTFVVNYDTASQQNAPIVDRSGTLTNPSATAKWNGLAAYASAAFTPKFSATLRAEYFNDTSGYRTGYAQLWREGTATLAYAPSAPLLFRLEVRHDLSDQRIFSTTDGIGTTGTTSFAFESIVKF